jgi:hypothetical protein
MIMLRNTYEIKKAEQEEKNQKETVPRPERPSGGRVRQPKKHVRKPVRKHG